MIFVPCYYLLAGDSSQRQYPHKPAQIINGFTAKSSSAAAVPQQLSPLHSIPGRLRPEGSSLDVHDLDDRGIPNPVKGDDRVPPLAVLELLRHH